MDWYKSRELKIGRAKFKFKRDEVFNSCNLCTVYDLPTNQWLQARINSVGMDEVVKKYKETLDNIKKYGSFNTLILNDTTRGGRLNCEILSKITNISTKPRRNFNTVNKTRTFIY